MMYVRYALNYKSAHINYFTRRTFLLHALATGTGFGIMQASQTLSPFINGSYGWATMFTSLNGLPLFPYIAFLSFSTTLIHSCVSVFSWILFNKTSHKPVRIVGIVCLCTILNGLLRCFLFFVQPAALPKTGTTLLDLLDSISLSAKTAAGSFFLPLSLAVVSLISATALCALTIVLSSRVLDGKISLESQLNPYQKFT
ncbi:hypothetical protein BLNAU_2808 [Blattamonas nauphoetae]|uniref:Uncharacterized protein n=1 Tax=Blattamonas nauphoetae TaxID=2049346 RepID=A0ABQ9YEE4_9EUKA|nr:hypothetical protein BLNAU_2808 [Blattamonas nauphoetae]